MIESSPSPSTLLTLSKSSSVKDSTIFQDLLLDPDTIPTSGGHFGTVPLKLERDYVEFLTTPTSASLSSIYSHPRSHNRQAYSSTRNNSCEGHQTRNSSVRSMSSIATSLDSVQNVPFTKHYDQKVVSLENSDPNDRKNLNNSRPVKPDDSPLATSHADSISTSNQVTSRSHPSSMDSLTSQEDLSDNKPANVPTIRHSTESDGLTDKLIPSLPAVADDPNFPLPQDSPPEPPPSSSDSSNTRSTGNLDHTSKYTQHSQPRLSISSSSSSITSHKLVTKTSASSLSGQARNFSLYSSPTSPNSTHPATGPQVAVPPPGSLTGIAIDHPVGIGTTTVPSAGTTDSVPLKMHPPPTSKGVAPSLPPIKTTEMNPPAPQPSVDLHRSPTSTVRSSAVMNRQNSMTITRRRSLPPQQIISTSERREYYAEELKMKRSDKHKLDTIEKKKNSIATPVQEGDASFAMGYYMLTGIRVTVSRCGAIAPGDTLKDADFTTRQKIAFSDNQSEVVPSAKYDFKFKDYSPKVFRELRRLFKIDTAEYLMSLTGEYRFYEAISSGKSGSYFYYSPDFRFIIKTIHHAEHKMLRKILRDYYSHVKNNPNTLISQFYGLHRVKLPYTGRKIHFVVMNNLFLPQHDVHRKYDLKGSSLGRKYKPPAVPPKDGLLEPIFKDLDWTEKGEKLKLGPIKQKQLVEQLRKDVTLLKRLNIMDYSLLVGINDKKKGEGHNQAVRVFENPKGDSSHRFEPGELRRQPTISRVVKDASTLARAAPPHLDHTFYNDDGGFQATDSQDVSLDEIYYLGVIDCLTPYTFFKRVETFWKSMSNTRSTISAIPAMEYGDRFFEFMKQAVSSNSQARADGAREDTPLLSAEQTSEQIRPSIAKHLTAVTENVEDSR